MDEFKSAIFYCPVVDGDIQGEEIDGFDQDEIYVDTHGFGWWNGGLARLLLDIHEQGGHAMYFRGHALFDNIDDAKNMYLCEPEPTIREESDAPVVQHHPFGMVIPVWDTRRRMSLDPIKLVSVTVILFWQELS